MFFKFCLCICIVIILFVRTWWVVCISIGVSVYVTVTKQNSLANITRIYSWPKHAHLHVTFSARINKYMLIRMYVCHCVHYVVFRGIRTDIQWHNAKGYSYTVCMYFYMYTYMNTKIIITITITIMKNIQNLKDNLDNVTDNNSCRHNGA